MTECRTSLITAFSVEREGRDGDATYLLRRPSVRPSVRALLAPPFPAHALRSRELSSVRSRPRPYFPHHLRSKCHEHGRASEHAMVSEPFWRSGVPRIAAIQGRPIDELAAITGNQSQKFRAIQRNENPLSLQLRQTFASEG